MKLGLDAAVISHALFLPAPHTYAWLAFEPACFCTAGAAACCRRRRPLKARNTIYLKKINTKKHSLPRAAAVDQQRTGRARARGATVLGDGGHARVGEPDRPVRGVDGPQEEPFRQAR